MVEFAKRFHSIPETVEPAIDLGESLCVGIFRELFGEVDVSYFNSNLTFAAHGDFLELYKNTTYYSQEHERELVGVVKSHISSHGCISFKKSAILIIGRDPH